MSSAQTSPIPPRSIVCIADDDQPLPLLERLAAESPQAIAGVWLGDASGALRSRWQSASNGRWTIADQWEQWLSDEDLRLVVVSTRTPSQLDALRQLAATGKSVVIYPQLEHELSLPYELSLLADQTPFDVFPVRPLRQHAAIVELQQDIRSGTLGSGLHLQLERKLSAPSSSGQKLLSIPQMEAAWVEDAAILDFLTGPFGQLTATRAAEIDGRAPLSQIIVGSSGGPQAVWTCCPSDEAEWKLTATGQSAQVEILARGNDELTITRRHNGQAPATSSRTSDPLEVTLSQIRTFFSGSRNPHGLRELIRAYELLDASRRSLKRRRTIDLYYDAPTERGNFKTQMAAIGCGVLMYTLFAILIGLGAGELLRQIYGNAEHPGQINLPPWGSTLMTVIRILTFAPLGLFLALQFLMYFARTSREKS